MSMMSSDVMMWLGAVIKNARRGVLHKKHPASSALCLCVIWYFKTDVEWLGLCSCLNKLAGSVG